MHFKDQARQKQITFKQETLELTENGLHGEKSYPQILSDEDALKGSNFYCHNQPEEWQKLQHWAKKNRGKKVNFKAYGLKDMLRSEHIPYNLFFPLAQIQDRHNAKLSAFFADIVAMPIAEISEIRIEFAGYTPKEKLLNDLTSFDTYIGFKTSNGEKGVIGIEIKYTEQSYPWGKTEKARFSDPKSQYNQVALNSLAFQADKIEALKVPKYKQLWRNHLLGLALLQSKEIQHFCSLHVYPAFNTYQADVVSGYKERLSNLVEPTFTAITFEELFKRVEETMPNLLSIEWLNYLKARYLL